MRHRTILRAAVLALVALAAAPAPAAEAPAGRVGETRLDTLVEAAAAWVAQRMALPLPAELPEVAFATREKLTALRYAGEPGGGLEVVALYEESTRTLLMPQGWTGIDVVDLSILVHEMVHFMQDVAGQRFDCPTAREAAAYELQDAWLREAGTSLEAEFEVDGMTLMLLSACGYG